MRLSLLSLPPVPPVPPAHLLTRSPPLRSHAARRSSSRWARARSSLPGSTRWNRCRWVRWPTSSARRSSPTGSTVRHPPSRRTRRSRVTPCRNQGSAFGPLGSPQALRGLSAGFFQRPITPEAARSFGQPRPISRVGRGRFSAPAIARLGAWRSRFLALEIGLRSSCSTFTRSRSGRSCSRTARACF